METFDTDDGKIQLDDNKIWIHLDFPLRQNGWVLGTTIIVWFVFLFLEGVVRIYFPFVVIFIMILLFAAVFLYYLLRVVVYYVSKKRKLLTDISLIDSAGIIKYKEENFLVLKLRNGRFPRIKLGGDNCEGERLLEELRTMNTSISRLEFE